MDLSTYLPAVRQGGLITWRQAHEAGLDARDIARLVNSGVWHRVRKGVYADGTTWHALDVHRGQPILRIRAAHLVLAVPHVFSHDSAALLLGMGCPDGRTALVHLTRPDVRGGRIRAGIRHHGAPYADDDVCFVDDLPVLMPARTAIDLAREHGPDHGLAACDAALRSGVVSTDLDALLADMHHWPGIRAARAAVALADPGSESWLESRGRWFIHELGIGEPSTQFGLGFGSRTAWCDIRVGRHIFEIDGLAKYPTDSEEARRRALREEKVRQDFISGFKLGVSRLTHIDFEAGRAASQRRVLREFTDTCRRFGTDISDLAPYILPKVKGRRPAL